MVRKHNNSFTALLIYVDDIMLTGNDGYEIQHVKRHLDHLFKIKDLGSLWFFLRLEVARSKSGRILNQQKYALQLLFDAGLLAAKPATTPMDPSLKLQKEQGTPFCDATTYRRLVGRLLYLTTTRPDISFPVQELREFMANPTDIYYKAATRVFRYIKDSPSKGLFFPADNDLHPSAFSDSDWACCTDTRPSISGFLCFSRPSSCCLEIKETKYSFSKLFLS
ncbi:uncharacterized mitochondrial protein AtMg00810-like [Gastrolobium bilobum]|uniref:uncharacterized mitochondrial protein AtMg00810-like n=1 Tax=Gastrolobium bilobum TaxID=150636 RepID=UPI002AB0C578|nr:uncharacterized mitochondrial protein AtMg00810-like [Gastrolobium bilobum]